jgi:hypothetical protein
MGYDLHITRADYWFESDQQEISVAEWLDIVREDPELELDTTFYPHHAVWKGRSKYEKPWFDWSNGAIFTKYPDEPMIEKMTQIAQRLNAKVVGDDCEIYHPDGWVEKDNGKRYPWKDSLNPWWKRKLDKIMDRILERLASPWAFSNLK